MTDRAKQRDTIKTLQAKRFASMVYMYLRWIDAEMKKPSDHERGKRIALATNDLEKSTDMFVRFDIGLDWGPMNRMKQGKMNAAVASGND